ncbi:hypothetical protein LCGC14_2365890 [marine sediment metagenome]|uniref:Uncharacterized protein n=1 Tax=marine sediment metagenome TaxID=412755 RepID=A0A0F9F009_9ZZZZ
MRYIGRVRLKDDLTPGDNGRIADIAQFLVKPPGGWLRRRGHILRGLNEIVRILTHVKRPQFWHRAQINTYMEVHDLLRKGGPVDDQIPVKQRLKELAAYFCIEMGLTETRFKNEMTMSIIPELYIKIMRNQIEKWTMTALAHHSPDEIKKYTQKMRTQIAMARARGKEKIRQLPVRAMTPAGILGGIP